MWRGTLTQSRRAPCESVIARRPELVEGRRGNLRRRTRPSNGLRSLERPPRALLPLRGVLSSSEGRRGNLLAPEPRASAARSPSPLPSSSWDHIRPPVLRAPLLPAGSTCAAVLFLRPVSAS